MPEVPSATPAAPQRTFYLFHSPVIYVPILLGALIAWFAPQDVLERVPALQALVDAVRRVYLPLQRYAGKSSFPQVTALYFSLMVLHAPLHAIYIGREFARTFESRRAKVLASPETARVAAWITNLVLLPFAVIYSLYWDPGRVLAVTPLHDSRFALGVVGWLYAGGAAFMLVGAIGHSVHERLTGKLTRL